MLNNFHDIKNYLEPKLVNIIYKIIYYYSVNQIYATKIQKWLSLHTQIICTSVNNFMIENNLINNTDVKKTQFIFELYNKGYSGKNINLYENNTEYLDFILKQEVKMSYFDLIILSDQSSNTSCINKVHYFYYPSDIFYTPSNIKFISMELTYNNETYPIELKTDSYNHYIVNNIINDVFFKYYLLNVLNVSIDKDKDNFDYNVKFIDHNVNIITLLPNQYIVIKEDDYEIKTKDLEEQTVNDTRCDNTDSSNNDIEDNNSIFSDKSDDYIKLDSE
jgi:hypothetical protein